MLSGRWRRPGRPGRVARSLVSAWLLSALLYLSEARASYNPQSGECKGKGKECTGKRAPTSIMTSHNVCVMPANQQAARVFGTCAVLRIELMAFASALIIAALKRP